MGLEEKDGSGNGSVMAFDLGDKNGYEELDVGPALEEEVVAKRRNDTKRFVFACAVFASLNSVLLGYDVGVMSGAILFMQEDLKISDVQQEVLVGILSVISLVGSLAGGKTSDSIGRKWTIALAAIIFQSGATLMTLAPNFTILLTGRILAGVGLGFGLMIAPVYICEISPTVDRGSLTSFPEIFINIGILLGYISNYALSGLSPHINWRIMLGVGIIPSVLIAFALFVIPESPRWLVMRNRVDEARLVLAKINDNDKEVEERLKEIKLAAGTENYEARDREVWFELLNPSPSVRRMLFAGCGIQIFQQITGIDATVYYSPTIFKTAGIENETHVLAATVAVGFTKTIFILIAIVLIDKVGRKPLLYVSTIGMTVCLLGLSLTLLFMGKGTVVIFLAIFSVCGNVAFFSIGIGPICWVLSSEIYPLKLRAKASALGAVENRVFSGVIAMSFLSVSRTITVGGTFLIFAARSALSIVFVHTRLPETKGKSLEEIEMLFQDNVKLQGSKVELEDVVRLVRKDSSG